MYGLRLVASLVGGLKYGAVKNGPFTWVPQRMVFSWCAHDRWSEMSIWALFSNIFFFAMNIKWRRIFLHVLCASSLLQLSNLGWDSSICSLPFACDLITPLRVSLAPNGADRGSDQDYVQLPDVQCARLDMRQDWLRDTYEWWQGLHTNTYV